MCAAHRPVAHDGNTHTGVGRFLGAVRRVGPAGDPPLVVPDQRIERPAMVADTEAGARRVEHSSAAHELATLRASLETSVIAVLSAGRDRAAAE
jgi:hypothetical protein